jgi:hypothetical protein
MVISTPGSQYPIAEVEEAGGMYVPLVESIKLKCWETIAERLLYPNNKFSQSTSIN